MLCSLVITKLFLVFILIFVIKLQLLIFKIKYFIVFPWIEWSKNNPKEITKMDETIIFGTMMSLNVVWLCEIFAKEIGDCPQNQIKCIVCNGHCLRKRWSGVCLNSIFTFAHVVTELLSPSWLNHFQHSWAINNYIGMSTMGSQCYIRGSFKNCGSSLASSWTESELNTKLSGMPAMCFT